MAKRRHRRGRRKKNWFLRLSGPKKAAVCLGALVLALLASGVVYAATKLNKIDTQEIPKEDIVINQEAEAAGEGYTNVALFGGDSRTGQLEKGVRTDTIIVASLNNKTKEIKMVSVYRDTLLDIGDGTLQKCNAAYSFGGPEQAINTINRNLDLNITDFATVNFKALADAVDIVGGIKLTIKSEKELENLNDYIGNMNKINGGDSPKFEETGTYTFDGNQAVAYSRIRYMEGGDHERANHQRLVVEGIVKKVKQQPWKLKALADTVIPQCKTSLSTGDMTSLAMGLLRYSIVDSQAYPFDSVDERYGGIYYGFPLTVYSNTVKAHEYLYGTKDYEPTEELGRISDKVEAVTDDLGY